MILNNKGDPLLKSGPPAGQVLLERFAAAANGFPNEAVLDAAVNVLVNVIRQQVPKRMQALMFFDELFGRTKSILSMNYDAVTGGRRNIFAHDQHVVMDLHKDPEGL